MGSVTQKNIFSILFPKKILTGLNKDGILWSN